MKPGARGRPSTLAALLVLGACRRPAPELAAAEAGAPGPTPKLAPGERVSTVLLAGENAPRHALWTASGELVLATRSALVRVPRDPGKAPVLVPLPSAVEHVAPAGDDVVVLGADRVVRRARGAVVTEITRVDPGPTLREVAANAELVAVRTTFGGKDLVVFHRLEGGPALGLAALHDVDFAPSGAFAMDDEHLVTVPEGKVVHAFPTGRALGWLGDTAVHVDASGIRWADARTKRLATTKLPCAGTDVLDVAEKRVVRACEDRVLVVTPGGATVTVPLPGLKNLAGGRLPESVVGVSLALGGPDVLVELQALASKPRSVRVDLAQRIAAEVPESARPRVRAVPRARATFPLERAPLGSPSGDASVRIVDGAAVVERGGTTTTFGVPEAFGSAYLEARAGGLDVRSVPGVRMVMGDRGEDAGAPPPTVLRVGPPSPPPPPLGAQRMDVLEGVDTCVRSERRRLARGEVRFNDGPHLRDRADAVCFCEGDACRRAPLPLGMGMVDATERVLVARSFTDARTELAVLDHAGKVTTTSELPSRCETGRATAQGDVVALGCTLGGAGSTNAEIVELALPDLAVKRRTPIALDRPRDVLTVVAAGRAGHLLACWSPSALASRLVEPGTGKTLADLTLFAHVAVVRFDDGQVEIAGDERALAPALFCEVSGELRPFDACRAKALVKNRFRLD